MTAQMPLSVLSSLSAPPGSGHKSQMPGQGILSWWKWKPQTLKPWLEHSTGATSTPDIYSHLSCSGEPAQRENQALMAHGLPFVLPSPNALHSLPTKILTPLQWICFQIMQLCLLGLSPVPRVGRRGFCLHCPQIREHSSWHLQKCLSDTLLKAKSTF